MLCDFSLYLKMTQAGNLYKQYNQPHKHNIIINININREEREVHEWIQQVGGIIKECASRSGR